MDATTTLFHLPAELLRDVVELLLIGELKTLRLVCRRLASVSSSGRLFKSVTRSSDARTPPRSRLNARLIRDTMSGSFSSDHPSSIRALNVILISSRVTDDGDFRALIYRRIRPLMSGLTGLRELNLYINLEHGKISSSRNKLLPQNPLFGSGWVEDTRIHHPWRIRRTRELPHHGVKIYRWSRASPNAHKGRMSNIVAAAIGNAIAQSPELDELLISCESLSSTRNMGDILLPQSLTILTALKSLSMQGMKPPAMLSSVPLLSSLKSLTMWTETSEISLATTWKLLRERRVLLSVIRIDQLDGEALNYIRMDRDQRADMLSSLSISLPQTPLNGAPIATLDSLANRFWYDCLTAVSLDRETSTLASAKVSTTVMTLFIRPHEREHLNAIWSLGMLERSLKDPRFRIDKLRSLSLQVAVQRDWDGENLPWARDAISTVSKLLGGRPTLQNISINVIYLDRESVSISDEPDAAAQAVLSFDATEYLMRDGVLLVFELLYQVITIDEGMRREMLAPLREIGAPIVENSLMFVIDGGSYMEIQDSAVEY